VQKYIEIAIPDIPRHLEIKLQKERYQLKHNVKNYVEEVV